METRIKYFRGEDIIPLLDGPGQALLDYWNELRQDKPFPAKSDFDPTRVARALSGMQIIECAEPPIEFRYRLVGTREVDARGWDPTGRPVSEGFVGPSADLSIKHFRMTVESEEPLCLIGVFIQHNDLLAEVISLFLPMADQTGALRYIFTYTYDIPLGSKL